MHIHTHMYYNFMYKRYKHISLYSSFPSRFYFVILKKLGDGKGRMRPSFSSLFKRKKFEIILIFLLGAVSP